MRRLAASFLFLSVACLDFSGAHQRCVQNGRCAADGGTAGGGGASGGGALAGGGGGGDAGGGVAGGGVAGGGVAGGGVAGGGVAGGGVAGGGTAGGGMAEYDGGPRCAGSMRPHLQCGTPRVIANGGTFDDAALVVLADGLIAAYSVNQRVEAVQLSLDGGSRPLVSEATTGPVAHISLSAEGDVWALLYTTVAGQPLRCFSSASDAGTNVGVADVDVGGAVAVSRDGGVAVIRGGEPMFGWAISDAGCPTTALSTFTPRADSEYVSALHLPGTGPEGFRFTMSGFFNLFNGTVGMAALQPDGGLNDSRVSDSFGATHSHVAHVNTNRTHAMVAYSTTADGEVTYELAVRSLPLDLSQPVSLARHVLHEPSTWALAECGAGCMAIAFTPYDGPRHTGVIFTTDDEIIEPRSASDAGWDVVCETPLTTTSVAAAWLGGQLRFLVAEPTVVRLFTCDVPP